MDRQRNRRGIEFNSRGKKNRIIEVSNEFLLFQFDLATGKFSVHLKDRTGVSIQNAFARVVLSNGEKIQTSDKWTESHWTEATITKGKVKRKGSFNVTFKNSARRKLRNSSIKFFVEVPTDKPTILLKLEFFNDSGEPVHIKEFQPLVVERVEGGSFSLGSSIKNWRFLKNGFSTSSPCYSLALAELDKVCSVEYFRKDFNPRSKYNSVKGEFDSEWMVAFRDNAVGNSAVIGFVTMRENMSQVDFQTDQEENEMSGLWARSISDDIECEDGNSTSSEKVLVDLSGSVSDGLDRYADTVGLEMNAVPWKTIPTGWCSWYEFRENISEELILDVVEYYRSNREKYPIDYIQVDDGYFIHRGDWTIPNELFPHGMKFIAEKIKAAGFKPGIWLSPFQVSGGSKLFREHPDWIVRDEKGKPIGHEFDLSMKYSYYGLDCTNPQVIDWLRSLFRTVVEDWGYEYLKLDFLRDGAMDGARYDKNATRAQALTKGLEAIREEVGDRIFILGCLAPLGQAVGIVNSFRISADNATRWKSLLPFDCDAALGVSMRNIVLRYFMHNRFWTNDPDCVVARRGKERSEFPKAAELEYLDKGGTTTEDEVKFEITVLGLLDGSLFYSDDPIHLPPEREKYLPLLLPAYQGKAKIVDLLEGPLPKILNLKVRRSYGNWDLVGLLNWSDSPEDIQLEFTRLELKKNEFYHVFSFWDEKYIGRIKDAVTIEKIPAHSASLLSIREVRNTPQLICSTIHVTQGAAEVEEVTWREGEKKLEIMLSHPGRRGGKLFIYVPPPYMFKSVLSENAEVNSREEGADNLLLVIELSFKQSAKVTINFN